MKIVRVERILRFHNISIEPCLGRMDEAKVVRKKNYDCATDCNHTSPAVTNLAVFG